MLALSAVFNIASTLPTLLVVNGEAVVATAAPLLFHELLSGVLIAASLAKKPDWTDGLPEAVAVILIPTVVAELFHKRNTSIIYVLLASALKVNSESLATVVVAFA